MKEALELMNTAYENWKKEHGDFWEKSYEYKCIFENKIPSEEGLNDFLVGRFSIWLTEAI